MSNTTAATPTQANHPPYPVTQILHFRNKRRATPERGGHLFDDLKWQAAMNYIVESPGFQRVYWGESLECPEHVEVHVVRPTLHQHNIFLSSPSYAFFLALIAVLTNNPTSKPVIRHALLRDFTPNSRALARGAPFSGTAIYLNTTPAWNEGAWPLWTHVVRNVPGCMGCSGGEILEEEVESVKGRMKGEGKKESFRRCYVVYVGWETTEAHHEYHGTQHFREHSVILRCGNEGWAEYGHVVFKGERVKGLGAKL